jgi:hypothetical protein
MEGLGFAESARHQFRRDVVCSLASNRKNCGRRSARAAQRVSLRCIMDVLSAHFGFGLAFGVSRFCNNCLVEKGLLWLNGSCIAGESNKYTAFIYLNFSGYTYSASNSPPSSLTPTTPQT